MEFPVPAAAPVTGPVMVPSVHPKLLAVLADRLMLVAVPLQIILVAEVDITGVGLTVTVMV